MRLRDSWRIPPRYCLAQDFIKIRALQKHIQWALKQLVSPQSPIYGWLGLILSLIVYALLKPTPFQAPQYPGNVVIYPPFALPEQIKPAKAMFARAQNKYKSYKNINCACFRMLDENVADQFKVSNIPTLTGWNTSMSIREMPDQLKGSYGKPKRMMLFANDTLFRSVLNPNKAPETLFTELNNARRYRSWSVTHIPTSRWLTIAPGY